MRYALPRSFPARYQSECQACPKPIEVGQRAIILGKVTDPETGRTKKAVYHPTCLKRMLRKLREVQMEVRGSVPEGTRRVRTSDGGWMSL